MESSPNGTVQSGNAENRMSPINALPGELFLGILLDTLDYEALLGPQLHNLAQVCTYWFQSIISTPRFWHVIDFFAPMVINRNPVGPLTLRCRSHLVDHPFINFMEMARKQVHRWVTLEAVGSFADMDPFDTPTPRLETLNVMNQLHSNPIFPLSATPNLIHVRVQGVRLPWDSPSLSGLKSISIDSIHPLRPSLHQLIAILSASPALEWLAVKQVFGLPPLGAENHLPRTTLSLPQLQGLYLAPDISISITSHPLGTVDAHHCRILRATVPFHSLGHLGRTFAKLASLPMRTADGINVRCFDNNISLLITSPSNSSSENFYHGWRDGDDAGHVQLSIKNIPHTPGSLDSIFEFLSLSVNIAGVALNFYSYQNGVDPARFFDDHPILCNSTTKLLFYGDCASTLRFLSNPVIENGRAQWHCPRLVRLRLIGLDIAFRSQVAAAVVDFLEKRLMDETVEDRLSDGEANVTWDFPVQLEFVEAGSLTIEMIRGAKAAEGVQLVAQ